MSTGLTACKKDYLERFPESAVRPEDSFKTEKDLGLFTKSFYDAALPSAEGVYNESVDNIVKTTLDDELTGKRQVPISGGGWSWANLRNINYFWKTVLILFRRRLLHPMQRRLDSFVLIFTSIN
ncbi:hypothetical protein KUH03_32615 [Sphingobacterium sp. E70]|uniref:hypothetical protein n=1 Tax=Sphingobacterium sp. E70 TaxID=2853439 RepID=UPI00211BB34B|nr:hypothetical protein [Sphingobacterium sp. E70]ULT23839.1 hypothetical protein KUH03_32615 [Sphingobacterium sp. E70]